MLSIIGPIERGNDWIEMGGWLVIIPFLFILLGYFSASMKTGILVGLSIYFFMIVGYWDSVVREGVWSSLTDDGAVFYPLGYMALSSISSLYSARKRFKGRSPDDIHTYDDETRIY
jgi:hypothetical protein